MYLHVILDIRIRRIILSFRGQFRYPYSEVLLYLRLTYRPLWNLYHIGLFLSHHVRESPMVWSHYIAVCTLIKQKAPVVYRWDTLAGASHRVSARLSMVSGRTVVLWHALATKPGFPYLGLHKVHQTKLSRGKPIASRCCPISQGLLKERMEFSFLPVKLHALWLTYSTSAALVNNTASTPRHQLGDIPP
jgi:hypothetical protein